MNWLGWSTLAFLGAIAGGLLGATAYALALSRGWDAPYLVGVFTGLGALVGSPDKSDLRALLIATAAIWIAAAVQASVGPFASAGLTGFHATLGPARLAAYAASGAAAFALARTSLRKKAVRRTVGA